MYSINGVPLDNPTYDWHFRPQSVPFAGYDLAAPSVRAPGMDGVVDGPATVGPPLLPLTVNTPWEHRETLNALFRSTPLILTVTGDSSRSAEVALRSSSVDAIYKHERLIDVTYYVEIPGAYWRSASIITSPAVSLSSASVDVSGLFVGLSAPIQDAIVRVRGQFSGLQVTDSGGSWFTGPPTAVAAGNYLRFESDTGRAFVTTSDTWTGGTEVSGSIDFGGPRGVFEIMPRLAAGNPASRDGKLTVTTATRSNAQIQVRGRAAFAV